MARAPFSGPEPTADPAADPLRELWQKARAERQLLLQREGSLPVSVQQAQRAALAPVRPSGWTFRWSPMVRPVQLVVAGGSVAVTLAGAAALGSWSLHRRPPNPAPTAAQAPSAPAAGVPAVASGPLPLAPALAGSARRAPAKDSCPAKPVGEPPVRARLAESAEPEPLQVAGVLRQLERNRDPEAALQAVARYHRDYPHGSLRGAIDIAEVQADLALGRGGEALRLIETLTAEGRAGVELNARKAELLERRGETAEAAAAWGEVLGLAPSAGLRLRALCGRGLDGPRSQSREDLERCLALDPGGPFAERAQAALDGD